jgi:hypothetical protein
LDDGLAVVSEFVAGLLLVPPQRVTGLLLRPVPHTVLGRLLPSVIRMERAALARPFLRNVVGLHGITAIRHRDAAGA